MLAKHFSYVLVDSRTGHTDIGGICTMLMPEILVLVFTPNNQSLHGVIDLGRQSIDYRRRSNDLRPLRIFPLPSRVEASEPKLRDDWRFGNSEQKIIGYQPVFEEFLAGEFDTAEKAYQESIRIDQEYENSYYSLGILDMHQGDYRAAQGIFSDLLERNDRHWPARASRAAAYLQLAMSFDSGSQKHDDYLEKAEKDAREAIRLNNDVTATGLLIRIQLIRQIDQASAACSATEPRIPIHIGREEDRRTAELVSTFLKKEGYCVPGIKLVKDFPESNELRFYHKTERKTANTIKELLKPQSSPIDVFFARRESPVATKNLIISNTNMV